MDTTTLNVEATETLSKVNDLLDFIGKSAESAQGFALEQAPLVAKEILAWGLWSAVFSAAIFACLSIGGLILRWRCSASLDRDEVAGKDIFAEGARVGGWILGWIVAIGCGVGAFFWLFEIIKIIIAPRLYLLEWCRDAIN